MNPSTYEKIWSWNFTKLQNRTEDGIVVDLKIQKVKNVGFLCIQKAYIINSMYDYKKHTSTAAYMIQLAFVYILYSLYIVWMHKKHTNAVLVS